MLSAVQPLRAAGPQHDGLAVPGVRHSPLPLGQRRRRPVERSLRQVPEPRPSLPCRRGRVGVSGERLANRPPGLGDDELVGVGQNDPVEVGQRLAHPLKHRRSQFVVQPAAHQAPGLDACPPRGGFDGPVRGLVIDKDDPPRPVRQVMVHQGGDQRPLVVDDANDGEIRRRRRRPVVGRVFAVELLQGGLGQVPPGLFRVEQQTLAVELADQRGRLVLPEVQRRVRLGPTPEAVDLPPVAGVKVGVTRPTEGAGEMPGAGRVAGPAEVRPLPRPDQRVRLQQPPHQRPIIQTRLVHRLRPPANRRRPPAARHAFRVSVEGRVRRISQAAQCLQERGESGHLAQRRVVRPLDKLAAETGQGRADGRRRLRLRSGRHADHPAAVEQGNPPPQLVHVPAPCLPAAPGVGVDVVDQVADTAGVRRGRVRLVVRTDGAAGQPRRRRPGRAFPVSCARERL